MFEFYYVMLPFSLNLNMFEFAGEDIMTFATKHEAQAAAKLLDLPKPQVARVGNRFWRGWGLAGSDGCFVKECPVFKLIHGTGRII